LLKKYWLKEFAMKIDKNELNIYDVESFHQQMIEELKKESIIIDFIEVNRVDASIIQLLLSTYKSAKSLSKEFQLINVSEEVLDIFQSYFCDTILVGSKNE